MSEIRKLLVACPKIPSIKEHETLVGGKLGSLGTLYTPSEDANAYPRTQNPREPYIEPGWAGPTCWKRSDRGFCAEKM